MIAALYRAEAPMLERFFRRSVRNRETAEDLMQETFARALRGTYSEGTQTAHVAVADR